MTMTNLTQTVREIAELRAQLAAHTEAAKTETSRLNHEIDKRAKLLAVGESGLDVEKISLARTVIYAWDYKKGGKDWASCRDDAVKQLATGTPINEHYKNLWRGFFGTKNYDGWRGQRSDSKYGYGPRHGSTCFEIGILREVREREPQALTAEETEAAIYFLLNLERIQDAEATVAA